MQPFAEDPRIEPRFLNPPAPFSGDTAIGGQAIQGVNTSPAPGQLGKIVYYNEAQANQLSNPAGPQLHAGFYQYVQFLSTSTAAPAKGAVAFWSDMGNYVVTMDAAAGNLGQAAGICLIAVTKGLYWWIQIGGRASCQYKATVTDTTVGNLVVVDQTPSNGVDALADATAVTDKVLRSKLGNALGTPANAGLALVQLDPLLRAL